MYFFILTKCLISRVGKYKFFLGADLDEEPQDWLVDLDGKLACHF